MALQDLAINFLRNAKSKSPEILTALGVSGVITTSYLTAKASFAARDALQMAPDDMPFKEKAKIVWKFYIPAGISGVVTIGCIIGASKSNSRRTAAAVTAYSLTEKAFSEYKEKVVEQIGKGKEQAIVDEIAQEKVTKNPPADGIVISGPGKVLCCELFTHRYFISDMESLKKAENRINSLALKRFDFVTLEDFYDLVGLQYTSVSDKIGWNYEKLMELKFSTVLSEKGEPCLAFDYNYTQPLN